MNPGRMSVVVNNYNYAAYLSAAIDSALAQTHPEVEVIVVDDGSTDESRDVIARYGDRVTAVLKENGGQASACNAGFAASRGDVVIFLDADDVLLPTAVSRAMERFRDPAVVKVHWPAWEIDETGRNLNRRKPACQLAEGDLREEVVRVGYVSQCNASTSANAWRRSFLEQVLPIRDSGDRHGADAYLNTLAPIFGRIAVVAEPQGCYRIHADNFAAHLTRRARLLRDRRRHEFLSHALQEFLARQGTVVDRRTWEVAGTYRAWIEELIGVSDRLGALLPPGVDFILVDDDELGQGFVQDRRSLPFLECDGVFFGRPEDDAQAIRELERMRAAGAGSIVFLRDTRWWLDHYAGLHAHLRATAYCIVAEDGLVLFDLRRVAFGATSNRGIRL